MQSFLNPESTYFIGQLVFIKILALTYLIAFGSLLVQLKGLYGSQGILPMEEIFRGMRRGKGFWHYYYTPSLFWINTSDQMLHGVAIVGILASLVALSGYAVSWMLLLAFILYLTYVSSCLYFLSFQWDILLLEVGFAGWVFSLQTPPLAITVFLIWVILFRFMFSSGIVKFLMGSSEWRDLSAMDYHYETQPLPNRFAYYFHHLPRWFSKLTTIVIFLVEIVLPFFIFTSPEIRFVVFIVMVLFQLIIMLTGNFAFFNILTLALCFPLVDDTYFSFSAASPPELKIDLTTSVFVSLLSMTLIVLNFFQLVYLFSPLHFMERILRFINPFYIVNGYGLFSHMTTYRHEIIIEGSDDGETWKAYEFKWKPGNLRQPPQQVAPHQPRLDWQMWFAALGNVRQNPWFIRLIYRLLEGSPAVLKLMKDNPFPDKSPKYIRALLYDYHFTSEEEKKQSGEWWKRRYIGVYLPPISHKGEE